MKVKECMCDSVCCVKSNTTINEVAKLMNSNHTGCIPVCDESNCIVGVVTDRDLVLRCVACDKDANQTPVSEVMSCNPCTCGEDDDVCKAEDEMSNNQIRRIPVCDCDNHVVGILTMGDLANSCNELGKQEVCTTIENICNCNGKNKNAE